VLVSHLAPDGSPAGLRFFGGRVRRCSQQDSRSLVVVGMARLEDLLVSPIGWR
jgi:hypothetical protein